MGGFPFSGQGIKTSTSHTLTHRLHPLQLSGLNVTGELGVHLLGNAYTFFWDTIISSLPFNDSVFHIFQPRVSKSRATSRR